MNISTVKRRAMRSGVAIALAVGTGLAGFEAYRYVATGRFLVATDDAYVKADVTAIAPKVSGYVSEVLVDDNQPVKAGAVLARIDDRDFQTALTQAAANVATARADIAGIDARVDLQKAVIAQAEASVAADQAALEFARQDRKRYRDLMHMGFGTVQHAQQTDAAFHTKSAVLQRDESALAAARRQIAVLGADRGRAAAVLDQKIGALEQARLNLSYTTIRAPIAGTVGARNVRIGQYVQAGTQMMAVVPLQSVYVVANFKETQIANVRKGQRATVEIDGLDGASVEGKVDSLAPASGLEFALLPPDNATGNFTKIVQRIPVKIALAPDAALAGRLRPGMSVTATVDTKPSVHTASEIAFR